MRAVDAYIVIVMLHIHIRHIIYIYILYLPTQLSTVNTIDWRNNFGKASVVPASVISIYKVNIEEEKMRIYGLMYSRILRIQMNYSSKSLF